MSAKAWTILASAAIIALLPLAASSPLSLDTHIVASEKPGGYNYVVSEAIVDVAGTLLFTNADLRGHDVVAVDNGPTTNGWCSRYEENACPLFASPLIDLGAQAVVEGTDQLTPLETYTFYCTVHKWMVGTLTVV